MDHFIAALAVLAIVVILTAAISLIFHLTLSTALWVLFLIAIVFCIIFLIL